jgi:uncharacterized protein YfiM (DUF2279 family)
MSSTRHLAAAAILAAAATLATAAPCTARDRWTGHDKALHLGAGAFAAYGATAGLRDPWAGLAVGAAVGLAKEAADRRAGGTCSLQDLAATVAGAAIGAGFAGWMLTIDARQVRATYTTTF